MSDGKTTFLDATKRDVRILSGHTAKHRRDYMVNIEQLSAQPPTLSQLSPFVLPLATGSHIKKRVMMCRGKLKSERHIRLCAHERTFPVENV